MNFSPRQAFRAISNHFLLRHIILAVCAIIVFVFIAYVALGIFTRHSERHEVPDFVNKNLYSAQTLTEEAELELVVIDSIFVAGMEPGIIIDQSPEPKSFVKSGRKIFLVINSMNPRSEIIPYVTGYSLRQAKNILQSRGFTIDRLIYKPDIATNNVIGQSYKGREITQNSDQIAVLGQGITLTVGKASGAALPLIPKVVGLSVREAQSRLWEVGINVGDIIYDSSVGKMQKNEAKVYKQSPNQQSRIDYGGKVTLYMSLDDQRIQSGAKRSDSDIIDARENPVDEISEEELEEFFSE